MVKILSMTKIEGEILDLKKRHLLKIQCASYS